MLRFRWSCLSKAVPQEGALQWCFEASDADVAHCNVLIVCNLSCSSADIVVLSPYDLYARNELCYLLITTSMIPVNSQQVGA